MTERSSTGEDIVDIVDGSQRVAFVMFVAGAVVASAALGVTYLVSHVSPPPLTPFQRAGCGDSLTSDQAPRDYVSFMEDGNASQGSDHWFNFSLYVDASNLTLSDLWLNLSGPRGAVTFPSGGGIEIIRNSTKTLEGTDVPGTGWAYQPGFGPDTRVFNQDQLSIFWSGSVPVTLVGDALNLDSPCEGYGGAIW